MPILIRHHKKQVWQGLIIFGVILFSAIFSQILPKEYLMVPILLILALGGLIIIMRFPPIGVIALIVSGLLIPFEIGTNTQTSINVVILLLPLLITVWFVDMMVRQRKISFVASQQMLPLIGFAIICLISFGIGQIPWFLYASPAPLMSQLGGLAVFLLSVGAYVLTANTVPNIEWLKKLTWIFLLLGTVYILARVVPHLGLSLRGLFPREVGGSLFWVWVVAIAYSQFLINRKLEIIPKLILLGLIAITLYSTVIIGFSWKSGWIPPLVAIGAITWIRYTRIRLVLAIFGIAVIGLLYQELIQTDEYSFVTRLEAWRIILNEIVRVNPVFGLGPANYRFYTPLFSIFGYNVQFNSHNNYVDIIAQVGLLGLFFFVWFSIEVIRSCLRLIKERLDGFSQAYVAGAFGGLIGMLVAGMLGDWVLPFVYNVGLGGFRASIFGWIFLGGLVVIEKVNNSRVNLETQTSELKRSSESELGSEYI
jgi:hypothetical protein